MAYFVPHNVSNDLVEVTARYAGLKPLRVDTSGFVYFARDQILQQNVMLKKFAEPFATESIAKRMFRELITLKHLKHENIVNLVDVFMSPSEDIYLISELMETDLKTLLGTRGIEKEYVQYFLYQIMRGLKYAHSAGVFHHDLEPSQILVNRNCDLKICNFGIAYVYNSSATAYGSMLHYKAPEVLISTQNYHGQTDIWSAGCIFAELLMGKPLFPGDNSIHQLHAITKLLGSPPDNMLINEITKTNPSFLLLLPRSEGRPLSSVLPDVDPSGMFESAAGEKFVPTAAAINVLKKMIVFDPHKRVTASEALAFPYLAPYHDPTDEPEAASKLDWSLVEANNSLHAWKAKVLTEVEQYHEEAQLRETVWSWLQVQPTKKYSCV